MKVVAFSLWGEEEAYYRGAIENARLINSKYYLGWQSWFFVGKDVRDTYLRELNKFADKVIFVNRSDFSLSFERFSPVLFKNVDVSVSRDTDSRVSDKEYQAVLNWEKSEKIFHCMRDHELHNFPIMAGMWGAKSSMCRSVKKDYQAIFEKREDRFESDQLCLMDFYKKYRNLFLEHDKFKRYQGAPYPSHGDFLTGSFIGQRINKNNAPASDMKSFAKGGY
jgi:hypothetical protein